NPQLTANQIMTNLLGAPYGDLTVGKLGQSFTLRQANASSDADCVVKKLPANSTPTTLPAGNGVFTGGCNTSTNIPTGSGGKWQNVLLGQTITLAFNIRYDASLHGGPPNGLGGLTICSTMVTQGSLPGPDGKPGSGDEVIDPSSPLLTVTIPNNVMCALLTIGDHTQTVHNLLELANLALAGQAPAGVSVADVNFAVNSINVGFDRCRFLISCTGGCSNASNLFNPNGPDRMVAQSYRQFGFAPLANSFNPFDWAANALFQPNLGAIALVGNEATIEERFVSWLQPRRRSRWWM